MTAPDGFDRLLHAWFQDEPVVREPESLLGDVLARIARTRRRPAWLIPERWVPMLRTMHLQPVPRLVPLVILLALLTIALASAMLILAGQHRLPPPFGVAANGRIAYVSSDQLWIAEPDGADARPITSSASTGGVAGLPLFSPDGTRLAFLVHQSTSLDPTFRADLVISDADGQHQVTIVEGVQAMRHVAFSPDSSRIAFSYWATDVSTYQRDRIFLAAVDGSAPPVRVGDPDLSAFYPAFSPDGGRIAFVSDLSPDRCAPGDCTGRYTFALHVMAVDGSGVTSLAKAAIQPAMDSGLDRWARLIDWHPSGTRLLFTGLSLDAPASTGVYVVAADGHSAPERLDTGPGSAYGATWSPAGDRIAYVRDDAGRFAAIVADADGRNARVVRSDIQAFAPQWSPDGGSVAVVERIEGSTATITIVSVDGGEPDITVEITVAGSRLPTEAGIDQLSWQRMAP